MLRRTELVEHLQTRDDLVVASDRQIIALVPAFMTRLVQLST